MFSTVFYRSAAYMCPKKQEKQDVIVDKITYKMTPRMKELIPEHLFTLDYNSDSDNSSAVISQHYNNFARSKTDLRPSSARPARGRTLNTRKGKSKAKSGSMSSFGKKEKSKGCCSKRSPHSARTVSAQSVCGKTDRSGLNTSSVGELQTSNNNVKVQRDSCGDDSFLPDVSPVKCPSSRRHQCRPQSRAERRANISGCGGELGGFQCTSGVNIDTELYCRNTCTL